MPDSPLSRVPHADLANAVRVLAMDAVERAKSGHPGLPMGAADVATVLFTRFLRYDAADPGWFDRDRFILSAGHGSMLLYALLHLIGVESLPVEELKRFRQLESRTPGHPENFMTPGVETTTGPLGQGLATAVGFALAERILAAEFGDGIVDHRTWVLASDGDLMEGVSHEAIALAGHLRLRKLTVLFDDNGITIDGPLSLSDSVDQVARFRACGWAAEAVDGHDPEAIAAALTRAQTSDRPTLIACRTTIGYGAPKRAGTSKAHGEPLGAEELAGAKQALGWTLPPFELPEAVREAWRVAGRRGAPDRAAWAERFAALPPERRAELERRIARRAPEALGEAIGALKARLVADPKAMATRKASELALEAVAGAVPELVLGSADLTGSNNTRPGGLTPVAPGAYGGRYVFYGIREHGMAAAMNGMALHGGLAAAGGTFLVFSDYARPAIRVAALARVPVVHVFTHDSIGLGEDGPTHQPVEHLAALRALPNLRVFRPADAVETAECWQLAIERREGPTALALTRQNLEPVRRTASAENLCAGGAYELSPAKGRAQATLFASGSEVEIALQAQTMLAERNFPVRVVSVPSLELFLSRPKAEQAAVIGDAPVRVAIEAAVRWGWDAVIGEDGIFVGMQGFGASAPAADLYRHFGITAEAVAERLVRTHNL